MADGNHDNPKGPAPLADENGCKILVQHFMFCQTHLPYRDRVVGARDWVLRAGFFSLRIVADSAGEDGIDVGLPFGSAARLALYHLNTEAMRTRSPLIDLEHSLTDFMRRTRGLNPGGGSIRAIYDQVVRLAAAKFCFDLIREGKLVVFEGHIIRNVEFCKSDGPHRAARPTLAMRLPRLGENHPTLVSWPLLKERFGEGYGHMVEFKGAFEGTLCIIEHAYPEAQFKTDDAGMHLMHSPSPTAKCLHAVPIH